MNSNKKMARLAGALYLVVVLSGLFSLMYVPGQLISWNDPSATFNNISNNQILFRMGVASSLICYFFFLLLPLVLYRLLNYVNRDMAILMVIFVAMSVPISMLNVQHHFTVLTLTSGDQLLSSIDPQLPAQVMLALRSYNSGNIIAQLFWGLWLFPFGYLVYHSRILPRLLGAVLMIGSIGYVLDFFGKILIHNYFELGIGTFLTLPASIGEIGSCLWLLLAGARENTKSLKVEESSV